jgi:inner membrane protein
VAVDPLNELQIVDVRYSLLPQDIKPIWGIKVSPHAATDEHVQYYTSREDSRQALSTLIEMMFE